MDDSIPELPPNNRGTASDIADVSQPSDSVQAVLADLSSGGARWSPDRLKRLRDEGIIGEAVVRRGEGRFRFIEPRDRRRLHAINEIQVRFGLKKVSAGEIAFWLAVAGDAEIETSRIMFHIEAATARFAGLVTNVMARRAGARYIVEDTPHPETVKRLSKSFGKTIGQRVSMGAVIGGDAVLQTTVNLFLTQMPRGEVRQPGGTVGCGSVQIQ